MTESQKSHQSHEQDEPTADSAAPIDELATQIVCRSCGAVNAADAGTCAACRRFLPGNTTAMTHGGRRSLDRPEALAAIAGKRNELVRHLGGDTSSIQADLVTDYARLDVLIESVASNIEVVQAQEAVAVATEQDISAQYGLAVARARFAQSTGSAEEALMRFVKGSNP